MKFILCVQMCCTSSFVLCIRNQCLTSIFDLYDGRYFFKFPNGYYARVFK